MKIHFAKKNQGEILNVAAVVAEAIFPPSFRDFCVMYCFICLDCFPVFKSFLYFPERKVTDDCISGGHVSHVRKNRRNDARTKRFSTNTWKYHNTMREKKSSTLSKKKIKANQLQLHLLHIALQFFFRIQTFKNVSYFSASSARYFLSQKF